MNTEIKSPPPGIPARHDAKPPKPVAPVLRKGVGQETEGRLVPADQVKTREPLPKK